MARPRADGTPPRAVNKHRLTDLFVTSRKGGERDEFIWDVKQPGLALSADPWRAGQRPARGRRFGAGVRRLPCCHDADRRIKLRPERDGTTSVVKVTLVTSRLRSASARTFQRTGARRSGRTWRSSWRRSSSPIPANRRRGGTTCRNFASCSASGPTPVRELVASLDGCTGGEAGEITAEAGLARITCVPSPASRRPDCWKSHGAPRRSHRSGRGGRSGLPSRLRLRQRNGDVRR